VIDDQLKRDAEREDAARSLGDSAQAGGLAGLALAGALFLAGAVLRRRLRSKSARLRRT